MAFWCKSFGCVGAVVALVAVTGCGERETSRSPTETQENSQAATDTSSSQSAVGTRQEPSSPTNASAARGVVLANKELGMSVSGQGAENPARSLDTLERQVITLLPELREVYERERAHDAALMGSLDINMTIEPNGGVSDLRFPVKRVSHERLTTAAFEQLRVWVFPPADLPVQMRFTLLFIPPGMDEASVLLWEKRLGSRPIIEKVGEVAAPVAVAAVPAPEKRSAEEASQKPTKGEQASSSAKSSNGEKKTATTSPARPGKDEAASRPVVGWYRVRQPTVLRASPDMSAKAIARLRQGLRVRVVGVAKREWLEVHSVNKRPPGFLWREDVVPERTDRAEQR